MPPEGRLWRKKKNRKMVQAALNNRSGVSISRPSRAARHSLSKDFASTAQLPHWVPHPVMKLSCL
jgi:hypothetical protein